MSERSGIFRKTALILTFCLGGAVSAADWPTATPDEAGFVPDLARRLDAALASETGKGLHAVVVVRGGRVVYERYLTGDDERWGQKKRGVVFGPESLHDQRSISKSVVGLLYGVALAEGSVPPLDVPMLDAISRIRRSRRRSGAPVDHGEASPVDDLGPRLERG